METGNLQDTCIEYLLLRAISFMQLQTTRNDSKRESSMVVEHILPKVIIESISDFQLFISHPF